MNGINWHTRFFRDYEEVEYVFGLSFTPEQREQVQTYLYLGVRPETGGCWTCSPAYIRKLTGRIDRFENAVESGEVRWPWSGLPEDHGIA